MRLRTFIGLALSAGLAVAVGSADGQPPVLPPELAAKLKALDAAPDNPLAKYPPFEQVVKGAKVHEGLFTLHHKDDHVFAEIQPFQFDRPFLMPIAIAKGGGAMGGETRNFSEEWVLLFKKVNDRVFLVRRNTRYKATPGTPAARAVETAYADSVLMSLPIRTVNPMKGSVVLDLNQIFFTDLAQLDVGRLDPSRTAWHKVKAFKKNIELQVAATFAGGGFGGLMHLFGGGGTDGVIDDRGITLIVQYGLIELPDPGYQPRYADDRVGHFLTAVKDYSKETPDTPFVRMVNRWRLERADGSPWKEGGKLVPPKKKIVFWIENSVPEAYREAVREGILEWNKAFEKIGFKNAIEVRQQEGEEFDPEDATYSTFRWTAHDAGFAIGPSRANPLTGEIFDADILFDGSFIRTYRQEQRLYRDDKGTPFIADSPIEATHHGWDMPAHPLAFRGSPFAWQPGQKWELTPEMRAWQRTHAARAGVCQCASHKKSELMLAVAALAADAGTKDGEKVPDELLLQGVKEVTMHEVGHTLGLRHNFKASTMLPNDKLHDTAITRKQGLVGSVMDYTPANIAPKGTKQGDYFTSTLGPYDYWAIAYAYTPNDGDLKAIAERVADPTLTYGTDEDVYGTSDPLINRWDLGADPLAFAKDRVKLADGLFARLAETGADKGDGYQRVRDAFQVGLSQYGNAAFLASRYIGGVSMYRDHKGDPNGRDPLVPIPAVKQREALAFLAQTILTDKPFQFPPELLRRLAADRWSHWGESAGGVDFPINERVLGIQRTALRNVMSAGALRRIQNNARSAGKEEQPLELGEVFRTVTDSVFCDLPAVGSKQPPAGKSSVVSRNLQRAYVARLGEMVLGPRGSGGGSSSILFLMLGGGDTGGDVPADAKSLARMHLREVAARVDAALKEAKDDTTKAYLEETRERIAKVLDAKVSANEP